MKNNQIELEKALKKVKFDHTNEVDGYNTFTKADINELLSIILSWHKAQTIKVCERIERMKLMDMEHTEGKHHKTAYQVPFTEKTNDYNQALDDVILALKVEEVCGD